MSLIAWWPLDGSTVNQGIGNYPSINISNATVDNNGKIGKCYTSSGNAPSSNAFSFSTTKFSICAWVKIISVKKQWQRSVNIWGSNQYAGLGCEHSNGTLLGFHLYKTINGTNTSIFDNYAVNVELNTWVHYSMCFDGEKYYIYKNGVLVKSGNASNKNLTYDFTNISLFGGSGSSLSNGQNSSLNDIRIYNHCLSAKEVKELSEGLVLHYPMMMPDGIIGGENLLRNSATERTSKDTITIVSLSQFGIGALGTDNNVTVTASFDIKTSIAGAGFDIYIRGSSSNKLTKSTHKFTLSGTEYTHIECTLAKDVTGASAASLAFCTTSSGGNTQTGATFTIKNIRLELGSKATPWTPAPEDAPLWNNHMVYDASGYRHNATYTDESKPSFDTDTPLGLGSYKFEKTSDYVLKCSTGNLALANTDYSFGGWIYLNNWSVSSAAYILNGPGNGSTSPTMFNLVVQEANGMGLKAAIFNGTTASKNYRQVGLGSATSQLSTGWHHVMAVNNSSELVIYVDGKRMAADTAPFTSRTYTTTGALSTFATIGKNFTGKICDFRIYATALSAEDIERLYKVKATIDNDGNLYFHSVIENASIANSSLDKAGLLRASDIEEEGNTSRMYKDGPVKATKIYEFV